MINKVWEAMMIKKKVWMTLPAEEYDAVLIMTFHNIATRSIIIR
jgi:hypothetical protein